MKTDKERSIDLTHKAHQNDILWKKFIAMRLRDISNLPISEQSMMIYPRINIYIIKRSKSSKSYMKIKLLLIIVSVILFAFTCKKKTHSAADLNKKFHK